MIKKDDFGKFTFKDDQHFIIHMNQPGNTRKKTTNPNTEDKTKDSNQDLPNNEEALDETKGQSFISLLENLQNDL